MVLILGAALIGFVMGSNQVGISWKEQKNNEVSLSSTRSEFQQEHVPPNVYPSADVFIRREYRTPENMTMRRNCERVLNEKVEVAGFEKYDDTRLMATESAWVQGANSSD